MGAGLTVDSDPALHKIQGFSFSLSFNERNASRKGQTLLLKGCFTVFTYYCIYLSTYLLHIYQEWEAKCAITGKFVADFVVAVVLSVVNPCPDSPIFVFKHGHQHWGEAVTWLICSFKFKSKLGRTGQQHLQKLWEQSFQFLLFTLFFFIVEHHKKQLQSSRTFFNIILLDCCDYSQHKISVVLWKFAFLNLNKNKCSCSICNKPKIHRISVQTSLSYDYI